MSDLAPAGPAIPADLVNAYSTGLTSWRQIQDITGVDDFNLLLTQLGEQDLRLPRASRDRPTKAKEWMREILASKIVAA